MKKTKTIIGILLLLLFFTFPFLTGVKQFISIPSHIITFEQNAISLPGLSGDFSVVNKENDYKTVVADSIPHEIGNNELIIKKSNIPIKKVNVSVLEDKLIIPGGQSIGVQLHTLGVLVVGHHLVYSNDDKKSPGEAANIEIGDVLMEMDGTKVSKLEDVSPIVNNAGKSNKEITVKLKRGNDYINTSLHPKYNKKSHDYQIGLYIRDSATGIGTISFYDPESKNYGALGHVISDIDTQKPIEIHEGKIVKSSVTAIEKGNQGRPGEKQASFSMKDKQLGTITKNSPFGIFGKINHFEFDEKLQQPLPIALSNEVEVGPAKILTVVEGEEIEEFEIEIVNSIPQKFPATKGMVIKVTDEKLIEKTGGIVQGMSGSPIIQNNKIIGAVTHVFVNDPTSGYGVHIEWMLQEAGVNIYSDVSKAS